MERITLNMVPTGVLEICHASQYDIGREIRFDLIDGTDDFVLSGDEDITIFIRDFDGNLIESSAPNTSSNYVVWTSSEGELDVSGPAICELRVTKDDDVLGSANFIMEIEADPYADTGVHVETVGPADICTFETNLAEPLQSVIVDVEATGGNGTPDNPIPIVGYSSANITRCGVNLWDEEWEAGGINGTTGVNNNESNCIRSKNYIRVFPNQTLYFKAPTTWASHSIRGRCYKADGTYLQTLSFLDNTVFTIPTDCYLFRFVTPSGADITTYNNDISINYPSTDTTYHAYNGNTVTIAFGQTVYGGVLDVTRGKLTVTHGFYNGTWGDGGAEYAPDIMPDIKRRTFMVSPIAGNLVANNGKAKCNITDVFSTANNLNSPHFYVYDNLYLYAPRTLDDSTPVQCSYVLATPFDIDLTPEVISAIVGTNNVFADCGETTVKYLTVE